MRRVRHHILMKIIFLACCLGITGCMDSDTSEALSLGADLKVLYGNWVKDGRPQLADVDAYISSNRRQFFTYTNVVQVGSNYFHCRFSARSQNFRRKGVLVISDEQVLLWIGDQNNEIIVDPQKKRSFDQKKK
jgi:hypothetical protein